MKKNWIYIVIVIVILVVMGGYAYWMKSSQSSEPESQVIAVPDIQAPAGWQAEPQYLGFTIFEGSAGKIEVGAVKTGQTLEQWVATNYNENFPYATLIATSSASGSEAVTWALVNGHLILVDSDFESESPAGQALNYSVFDNGNVYTFTLLPYKFYDPTTQTYPINQPGIEALKEMVQNFAASLPPVK